MVPPMSATAKPSHTRRAVETVRWRELHGPNRVHRWIRMQVLQLVVLAMRSGIMAVNEINVASKASLIFLVRAEDEWSASLQDPLLDTPMTIASSMTIRPYQESDLPSITRIFRETSLLLDDDKAFEHRWATIAQKCVDTDLADIPSSYIAPGGNFWVATTKTFDYRDDSVVGMVALKRLSDSHEEVKRVSVDTKHHRKGIGRQLMNELETWAVDNGIKTLSLSTGVKSEKSVAFTSHWAMNCSRAASSPLCSRTLPTSSCAH
ncbi:hypothetical protein V7S43_010574 [Phytophthora oleae]|uniref:N-acetyltransferase domain-containing protein n=1 Tax=Phytophthora oleae TaxID=2107226 RepID=A0ABD3FBH4_9STRA